MSSFPFLDIQPNTPTLVIMRYVLAIVGVIILFSCQIDQPGAKVTLTSWSQVFNETSNKYNPVEIHYRIENTSDANIDSYTIYAEVTCDDGSKYDGSTFGYDLPAGEEKTDFFYIDTEGKKATDVAITNWEVKKW